MIPWPQRLYFWGVHWIFAEVVLTSLWGFVETGSWRLMGVSSVWSFLVYGLGTLLVAEPGHNILVSYRVPLLARCMIYVVFMRCVIYVVFTYTWEFSCGLIVECLFDWDKSEEFSSYIMGLIVMEYIPVWFLASLCFEGILALMKASGPIPRWTRTSSRTWC